MEKNIFTADPRLHIELLQTQLRICELLIKRNIDGPKEKYFSLRQERENILAAIQVKQIGDRQFPQTIGTL